MDQFILVCLTLVLEVLLQEFAGRAVFFIRCDY